MEHMIYMDTETPMGTIALREDGRGICALDFHAKEAGIKDISVIVEETPLLVEARKQLFEYFNGIRKEFSLPLSLKGTAFQMSVWNALCTIPYGELRSYKDIAVQVGCPMGFRAVGMANHVNPVAIIVPCHRVVGSNGSMTGYGGGIEVKEYLLELERQKS